VQIAHQATWPMLPARPGIGARFIYARDRTLTPARSLSYFSRYQLALGHLSFRACTRFARIRTGNMSTECA